MSVCSLIARELVRRLSLNFYGSFRVPWGWFVVHNVGVGGQKIGIFLAAAAREVWALFGKPSL